MRATSQLLAIVGTGAVTVLAGTVPASAAHTSAAPPSMTRIPISANVAGTATAAPSGNNVAFDAKGSGTLRGFGAITFEAKGTLNPHHTCPTFGAQETVRVTSGQAKGSVLRGHVEGYGCPQAKSPAVLDVQAVNRVYGGSGKFAGASGGWLVTGTFNLATGAFTHHLQGLVITPAH
jgi:hypothetical protein